MFREFHLMIILIGGILTFLPLLMGSRSNLEDSTLANALPSFEAKLSGVVSLTLCLPLTIDLIIDGLQKYFIANTSSKTNGKKSNISTTGVVDVVNHVEIMMVIVANSINHFVLFLPDDTRNLALLYVCARRCYSMLIVGSICFTLHRCSQKDFPKFLISFILMVYAIGSITGVFANNLDPSGKGVKDNHFAMVNKFFSYSAYVMIFLLSIRWQVISTSWGIRIICYINMICKKIRKYREDDGAVGDDKISEVVTISDPYLPFRIAYVLAALLHMISVMLIRLKFNLMAGADKYGLMITNISNAFLLLAIIAVNIRKVKYSSVKNLVSVPITTVNKHIIVINFINIISYNLDGYVRCQEAICAVHFS